MHTLRVELIYPITSCTLTDMSHCFGRIWCHHIHGNYSTDSSDYTSHPTRP